MLRGFIPQKAARTQAACIPDSEQLRVLLRHRDHVALELLLGCRHRDEPRGRAFGHTGLDFGVRDNCERRIILGNKLTGTIRGPLMARASSSRAQSRASGTVRKS